MLKRLGIFSVNDNDGIIDRYVIYLLNDLCENLDELCIVSNSKLTDESLEKLNKFSDNIILRQNTGFDVGAWRDIMINHYGFENLSEFDEIVLFNDSFFGPLYPFRDIFEKMDNENIDFWGITEHPESKKSHEADRSVFEYVPRHIQSYFLAFRKNIVKSNEFRKYWENISDYKSLDEVKSKHEFVLTKHFSDLGYNWSTYVPSPNIAETKEKGMDFVSFDMYDSVVEKRLPLLNIGAFAAQRESHLQYNLATDLPRTVDYVKENTDYDVSLIFEYLLRTTDPNQIVNCLNLIRVFPKNDLGQDYNTNKKILLIVHVYYDDLWEFDLNYLKNVPEYIDILITTDSYSKVEFFKEKIVNNLKNKTKIIKIEARGRDMASLLVDSRNFIKEYDYFCFMHDKKPHANEFAGWSKTFRDVLWENNLASNDYINNIIKEFDEKEHVGLIVPPKIHHGEFFFGYVNNYWAENNFMLTIEFLEQMGIKTPISRKNPPLALGNCFWAKYDALEPIFDLYLEHTDFSEEPLPVDGTISHAIERCYPYVAASRGYLTEVVMTEEYARTEILNYNYMLSNTLQIINSNNLTKDYLLSSFKYFHNSFTNFIKKLKK